jgi:hypothetical protein
MILVLLFAAAAEPQSAIDAERAFAADARELGQWTAFRKWSTPDALMFTPQAGKAHDFLKGKADPPVPVFWWPGQSYVSCDGNTAVNTGPWVREWGKSIGYFTTVWRRQADGSWKWLLDHGDALPVARAQGGDIKPFASVCKIKPGKDRYALMAFPAAAQGQGSSSDGSLRWYWLVQPGGARQLVVRQWIGGKFVTVVHDHVAPSP